MLEETRCVASFKRRNDPPVSPTGRKFLAIGFAAAFLLLGQIPAGAQKAPEAAPPAAKPPQQSAVDACNQFRDALKGPPAQGKQGPSERAQQSLGGVADAGQQGIVCAQALAKYFENLRKNGAKGTWSEIEREMDLVIDTYRNLLERIEGAGGAYEEGQRAVSVLDDQIKDIATRRGDTHQNAIEARKVRDGIAAGLEKTKNLKAVLDNVLVEMQSRKSEIVEAEGIQRYAAAQRALENMNEGLVKVIDELVKVLRKPGS
jgi:hypothetical protein